MPVQQNKTAQFVNAKSKVTAVAEAGLYAVEYADVDSKRAMALVVVFGKLEDGEPGVFILADNERLTANVKMATDMVRNAVRQHISAQLPASAGAVLAAASEVTSDGQTTTLDELGL